MLYFPFSRKKAIFLRCINSKLYFSEVFMCKCFFALDPQGKVFFEISWFYWIQIAILEKMRSCLLKLEPGFQTGLIHLLASSCPKLVFRPQTPNVTALVSKSFFLSNSIKFCMKQALIFNFCVIFDKVMSVLFPENYKKTHQKSSFWCHSRECAKFRCSGAIVHVMGLVPLCLCGYFIGPKFFLVGIAWVSIFSCGIWWVPNFSRGYFVGPNFFLMGISWVQDFF